MSFECPECGAEIGPTEDLCELCKASGLQPPPIGLAFPTGIEAEVCADIADRQRTGVAKYGTTVADNPIDLRAWLQHAYEEALDQAIYLRLAIAELDR